MSFPTVCSHCGSPYTFKDEFQGKKIRCKQCQEIFVAKKVEEPEEEIEDDLISKALGLDGAKNEMEPAMALTRESDVEERTAPKQEEMPAEKETVLARLEEEPIAELVEDQPSPKAAKAAKAMPPRSEKAPRKERVREDSWDEERAGLSKSQGSKALAVLAWALVLLVVLAGTAPAVYFMLYPDKVEDSTVNQAPSIGRGMGIAGPRPSQGNRTTSMGRPPTGKQPGATKKAS